MSVVQVIRVFLNLTTKLRIFSIGDGLLSPMRCLKNRQTRLRFYSGVQLFRC